MQLGIVLPVGGTIAMFINILGGTASRFQLLTALFVGVFWIYLLSINVLYSTTIAPMLPFLTLNIVLALNTLHSTNNNVWLQSGWGTDSDIPGHSYIASQSDHKGLPLQ